MYLAVFYAHAFPLIGLELMTAFGWLLGGLQHTNTA